MNRILRPDWRDPRDLRRPWRDPPGFFGPGSGNCRCCGVDTACCGSSTRIPKKLFITFAASHVCDINGATIEVNYIGISDHTPSDPTDFHKWEGSVTCGGNTYPVHLLLSTGSGTPGTPCGCGWELNVFKTGGPPFTIGPPFFCAFSTSATGSLLPTTCTCSPFYLEFEDGPMSGTGCCCPSGNQITAVVTE